MKHLGIDIFSDVICPWCFIGTRRLEQALASLRGAAGAADAAGADGVEVDVEYHPFLLDPTTPPGGGDLRDRLRAKYGADPDKMFAQVEAAARSSGIPLDFSKVTRFAATTAAHTLLRHARAKGTQRQLASALFEAYFLGGRDIGDPTVLASVAAPLGFEADEALRLVRDEDELSATRAEAQSATAQGIRGVPFFVFGGRFAVSGAQPPEVLLEAIGRATAA
jgi:predicted DsbA family dithiol-disulfide isomerase